MCICTVCDNILEQSSSGSTTSFPCNTDSFRQAVYLFFIPPLVPLSHMLPVKRHTLVFYKFQKAAKLRLKLNSEKQHHLHGW